jgi:hypothetical protein
MVPRHLDPDGCYTVGGAQLLVGESDHIDMITSKRKRFGVTLYTSVTGVVRIRYD